MGLYFSENLRFLLKSNSLKQSDIAEKIGKRQSSISNWIKGVSEPSLSDLISLNQYFDIKIEDLIFTDLSKAGITKKVLLREKEEDDTVIMDKKRVDTRQDLIDSQSKIIDLLEETAKFKDDRIASLEQDVKNLQQALKGKLNPDLIISRPNR